MFYNMKAHPIKKEEEEMLANPPHE